MKTNVTIFKILIDLNEIRFDAKGFGETQLIPNHEYSLFWCFYGEEGTTYDLSIIEPESINFHVAGTLDSSKKHCGVFWVKI
jgi:hypothetical protein